MLRNFNTHTSALFQRADMRVTCD